MTVLVTGGAGFVGANFVLDWLRSADEVVVNVDKLTYAGNLQNLEPVRDDPRHVFVHADVADADEIGTLLDRHMPRAIIHFAAESHVDRSIRGPDSFVQTNTVGTFKLLETVRDYWISLPRKLSDRFRFINVSTDEVYGSLGPSDEPFDESAPYRPNSPYAASKAAADHLARAYFHTYGLPVITTNSSNNYGPYQFPEKLVPLIILNGLRARKLPIYGDGLNVRDWLYVGDHCAAIRMVLDKGCPGETYNIGGNNEMTNVQIVEQLCTLLDELTDSRAVESHKRLITFVADRPGHDRRYAINARKIGESLGWKPSGSFSSTLRKTAQWYLDNPSWTANVESGEYKTWMDMNYARRAGLQ